MDIIISVIVPCYNQAQYLEETLKSVYSQSYSNWECIIVNDGSIDKTNEIAKKWCDLDSRFNYYSKINGGLSSARNFGLDRAKGRYIQFLDSDDLIKPEKFKEQLRDLNESQISISNYFAFIDGSNDKAPYRYLTPFLSENCFKKEIISDWEYKKSIPCHSVIFEKQIIDLNGLRFNEDLPNHEDWVFWVKLFYFSKSIKNNFKELALYRIQNKSMSTDFKLMKQGFLEAAKLLSEFFKNENNEVLYDVCKKKYKQIYYKNRISVYRRFKSLIYSKLSQCYNYVKKN